jgi:hypothetical protein
LVEVNPLTAHKAFISDQVKIGEINRYEERQFSPQKPSTHKAELS